MRHATAENLIHFLKANGLVLTTAESCTAGHIIAGLSDISGCGEVLECGYVVYSVPAKIRLLNVKESTIDRCNLTSEAVAEEMAKGALHDSTANAVIATTGVAGPEPMDGIPPGTVCFAWGFQSESGIHIKTATHHFDGPRKVVQEQAAEFGCDQLVAHYAQFERAGFKPKNIKEPIA